MNTICMFLGFSMMIIGAVLWNGAMAVLGFAVIYYT